MIDYKEHPGINYSLLTALDKSPQKCKKYFIEKKEQKPREYFELGSLVDAMLTDEKSLSKFTIRKYSNPGGKLGELLDKVVEFIPIEGKYGFNDINYVEHFNSARNSVGFQPKWTIETFTKNVIEDKSNIEYVKENLIKDSVLINQEDYSLAEELSNVLHTNPFTSPFLAKEDGIEYLFQTTLFWNKEGIDRKCKIDIIRINHNNKTYRIIDVKTTSSMYYNFWESMISYRYDIQGAYYDEAVSNNTSILNIEGYKADGVYFICVNTVNKLPFVYELTNLDMFCAEFGGTLRRYNRYLKGYKQLIEDFFWHVKEDKWDYSREVYKNKGLINSDLYAI